MSWKLKIVFKILFFFKLLLLSEVRDLFALISFLIMIRKW